MTVYGPRSCTINVGSLSDPNLIAAIIALSAKDQNDPVIRDQNLLWAFAYNMTLIPLAVMGFVPPWLAALGMSLSSLLVVGNACRLVRW